MDQESALQPSVSKACSRCHARKVKCDLRVPRCAACTRHDEDCNITECVAYPYAVVRMLQAEIMDLKARLQASTSQIEVAPVVVPPQRDQQAWSLGKEAEEVGILAIGGPSRHSEDKYVGSATGSTFARIFFKQLNLEPSWSSDRQGDSLDQCLSKSMAALPPRPTARLLLSRYIARVHTWWPFLQLPNLRKSFELVYQGPRKCSDADKFVVFVVLALASNECQEDTEYHSLMDLNEPDAYFSTSLRFFINFHDHPRDLFGVQAVILLTLWMLNSKQSSLYNDLWHLSRYLMSAGIEAGLHRHNADWGFSADELEIRNRTWWSIYTLERHVAIITGRVLSVRDHAIHALQPTTRRFDALNDAEARAAPTFHKHNVMPFQLMIKLRQISGRILESVYIGRGPDGKALATSFQQICTASDESRQDLELWKRELNEMDLKPSREYSEMKVEYCLLQLLLNRPSPTFMVPSGPMIAACSKATSSAVRQWLRIESQYGTSAVCRSFRQLHSILVVGLAGLYCDWQFIAVTRDSGPNSMPRTARHRGDTEACLRLIHDGVLQLQVPGLKRYKDLFQTVRNKVYTARTAGRASEAGFPLMGDIPEPYNISPADMNYVGGGSNMFFSDDKSIETYMSHVSSFFDDGVLDMDDALSAWYEAVMEEIQPPGNAAG